jgi:hypothetical protein
MDAAMQAVVDLIERIRAEYLEMPGLSLTSEQLERLCGIDRTMCNVVLQALIARKFLGLRPDGRYARLTDGESIRPRPGRADLVANRHARNAS